MQALVNVTAIGCRSFFAADNNNYKVTYTYYTYELFNARAGFTLLASNSHYTLQVDFMYLVFII